MFTGSVALQDRIYIQAVCTAAVQKFHGRKQDCCRTRVGAGKFGGDTKPGGSVDLPEGTRLYRGIQTSWMRFLGTWVSGGFDSVRLAVGLDDLRGLFQTK